MTRTGPRKAVDAAFGESRLRIARAFRASAAQLVSVESEAEIGNPAVSLTVSAAIAYADALSARFGGVVSQDEHGGAVKVLRDAIGNRLPTAQERTLKRILDRKPVAQYGSRIVSRADAAALLADLDAFAAWAEAEMKR
jgi:hypothetical protein